MNKTSLREVVLSRLAALNDQLCFFLLLEQELIRRLRDFGPGIQGAYTSDVFAQNPYAPKRHVRISQLPFFQASNRSFTFGAYFSTSYEVASEFFELAETLLVDINGIGVQTTRREGPEERYTRILTKAGLPLPAPEVISTMSYCRYRRNAFIHLGATPIRRYLDLAATDGSALNAYWGNTKDPVNFTEARISALEDAEAIALLKLLRISIEQLDFHLAGILDRDALVEELTRQRFGNETVRMNADIAKRRVRVISSLLKQQFGCSMANATVDSIVRRIGTR